jgi:hypothetical protein
LFVVPPERKTPPWILGVVVILMGNWQIMTHRPVVLAGVVIERRLPDIPQGQTPRSGGNGQWCCVTPPQQGPSHA